MLAETLITVAVQALGGERSLTACLAQQRSEYTSLDLGLRRVLKLCEAHPRFIENRATILAARANA